MEKNNPYCSVWFHYKNQKPALKINNNGHHHLYGSTKEVAKLLFTQMIVNAKDESISTSWNDQFKICHGAGKYELEWLNGTPPKFFNELNEEYKKLCQLRAFL